MSCADIFLAVPTRGTIQWATATRLEEIRDASPGLPPIVYQPGNLSVALTRNKIVRRFLETDCRVLAMVDDDVVPPPHFLDTRELLTDGFGMVAVPHPMPAPGGAELVFTIFDHDGEGFRAARPQSGLNECDAVATGAVVVSREALEELGPDPFRMPHDPTDPITSDDFLFCEALRAAGFRVGYFWDGWYCDHHTAVGLAPLIEERLVGSGL